MSNWHCAGILKDPAITNDPPAAKIAGHVRSLVAVKGDVFAVIAGDIRHRVPRPWGWPNILDLSPSLIVPGPGIIHAGRSEAITAEADGDGRLTLPFQ